MEIKCMTGLMFIWINVKPVISLPMPNAYAYAHKWLLDQSALYERQQCTYIHTYDYVDRSRITSTVSGVTKYFNQLNYKVFKSNNDNAMHQNLIYFYQVVMYIMKAWLIVSYLPMGGVSTNTPEKPYNAYKRNATSSFLQIEIKFITLSVKTLWW